MDWLIRVYTPAWLRLAGLCTAGAELAHLAPVIDDQSLQAALPSLEAARRRARSARAESFAEGSAPRPAAWASALTAGLAGREAAWACAGAAAWSAARVAIGDLAGDRARAAARAAAGDAAAIAVRHARAADGRADRDAARAALAPALAALTESAIGLLERMLPTEALALPAPEATFTTSV